MDWTQIILLIGLGLLVGFIGTLIGAGGGFILVPVLLLLYPDFKPEVITSISLGVVFLNAASGSVAYAKMKRIDYKSAIYFAVATLPGAIIGAFLTSYIPRRIFDLILGVILLVISIFLLINPKEGAFSNKDAGNVNRELTDKSGQHYSYSVNLRLGIILSFFVGFLSSLLGIGGGIIHVPALTSLLNFPIHIATATSHFILAIMALAGTLVHIIQGNLKDGWLTILLIGTGVTGGAQLGAYFSHHVKAGWIIRALAISLLLVGVRLLFM
jgi:Predicted permeases